MDKIKKNLNSIGLGLLALAVVSRWVWPTKRALVLVLAILGVIAIGIYIGLNVSQLKQGLKRKSFFYSSNMLLVIALVLAILVVVNIFFSRHHKRFDFTEAKLHSLSDQSIKLVRSLKNDITIKCFFREGNMSRSRMEALLKIYAYQSPKVKYEFIDPDKNPNLIKRYEITTDGTSIFESGDKENRITAATEEDITNAIVKITREKKKVIYFLEGHGEHSIEVTEENGYSFAKDELGKLAYEVKKLPLALADTFPKDCSLLVIPGPQKDLLPNELETITKYIEGGGRVFFMVDPLAANGLAASLAKFGFRIGNDVVVDRVSRLVGGDDFVPFIQDYESHEITKNFRYATFFPLARSVEAIDPKPEGVLTSQALGKTGPNSWSERELEDKKKVVFNKEKDKAGPISVCGVATIKASLAEGSGSPNEGRVAVFGDSDFVSNRYYNLSANSNFFFNTVNWLTEESDLISIAPKTSNPRTIQLMPAQIRIIFFVSVIILPLIILVLGISIWVRRRSL